MVQPEALEESRPLREVAFSICEELVAKLIRHDCPEGENPLADLSKLSHEITMAMPEGWRGKVEITKLDEITVKLDSPLATDLLPVFMERIRSDGPASPCFREWPFDHGFLISVTEVASS